MRRTSPIYIVSIFLMLFGVWASQFSLNESIRADATLVPVGRVQVVQVVDGGVLAELLVQEGDQVEAGQVLARLEDARANARQGEIEARRAALRVALERALAQAEDSQPDFDQFPTQWKAMVDAQRRLYAKTTRGYTEQIETLNAAVSLAQERYELLAKLGRSGDSSSLRLLEAEAELNKALQALETSKQTFRAEALREVAEIEGQLYTLEFQLNERANVVEKTIIAAPKAGVVTNLQFATLGAAIAPGDSLLSISPTQEEFELEIHISPSDVGALRVGLPVSAKLVAFDAAIYGDFKGELKLISADAATEQRGADKNTYFKGVAKVQWASNPKVDLGLLRAGMTATVDIITGSRTVADYLLKPIRRGLGEALTER